MPDDERPVYIGYEKGWKPVPCPECGKLATSHGFLSWEPPPEGAPDNRRAFGHVYLHEAGDDRTVAGSRYLSR